jgi:hypothetical protein
MNRQRRALLAGALVFAGAGRAKPHIWRKPPDVWNRTGHTNQKSW